MPVYTGLGREAEQTPVCNQGSHVAKQSAGYSLQNKVASVHLVHMADNPPLAPASPRGMGLDKIRRLVSRDI